MVKIKYIEITPEIKSWLDKILKSIRHKTISAEYSTIEDWKKYCFIWLNSRENSSVWLDILWNTFYNEIKLTINIKKFDVLSTYMIKHPKEYLKQFFVTEEEILGDNIIKILIKKRHDYKGKKLN